MSFYKDHYAMFSGRAESNEKNAAQEYAMYKEAKEKGDKEAAKKHYIRSQKCYKNVTDNKESAEKHKGQKFEPKRRQNGQKPV